MNRNELCRHYGVRLLGHNPSTRLMPLGHKVSVNDRPLYEAIGRLVKERYGCSSKSMQSHVSRNTSKIYFSTLRTLLKAPVRYESVLPKKTILQNVVISRFLVRLTELIHAMRKRLLFNGRLKSKT